jgi:hypothetical protein
MIVINNPEKYVCVHVCLKEGMNNKSIGRERVMTVLARDYSLFSFWKKNSGENTGQFKATSNKDCCKIINPTFNLA